MTDETPVHNTNRKKSNEGYIRSVKQKSKQNKNISYIAAISFPVLNNITNFEEFEVVTVPPEGGSKIRGK